jgi:hypothetical protein
MGAQTGAPQSFVLGAIIAVDAEEREAETYGCCLRIAVDF